MTDMQVTTIPQLLKRSVSLFGEAVAINDGDTVLSYQELGKRVEQATRGMMALGVAEGDRVAIWAPNIWEWVVAALGAHGAGGVLVPINTRFKGEEAAYVLEKSRAKVLFTVEGFLGFDYVKMLRGVRAGGGGEGPVSALPALETVVVLRGEVPAETMPWSAFCQLGDGVSFEEAQGRTESVCADALSDILFTSGTTGAPKGVMTTHEQNLRAFEAWTEVVGLAAGDRYLIVNPFFHAFGYKAGWLSALMRGATIFPHAVFDVPSVMERVSAEKITVLPGPPALFQTILGNPRLQEFDLSSLRLCVTGAAVIPVELIERLGTELHFETIITGYGLTEACGIATMCRYDDDPTTIATTSGRAIPDVEVEVHDESGAQVPRGEPGELVVRGYNVMQGYFEDEAQTAQTVDDDGWLHTGDIAVMDQKGYIRITDRKKDMFIMGGFNCYPAEIERMMLRNEDLVEVAVIGVPDERMGEVGMAYVVAREGSAVDGDSIREWCRETMANYKVPRYFEVVSELPHNATGKVQKFILRERVASALEVGRIPGSYDV